MRTYTGLWLCSLDHSQHARTCGYWYTITAPAGTPHNAFRTRVALRNWLELVGIKTTADIPDAGTWSSQQLVGTYRTECHLYDAAEFMALNGDHSRTLSNGDYVQSIVTTDPYDGFRTVHTLNPNVKDRVVFNYQDSNEVFS